MLNPSLRSEHTPASEAGHARRAGWRGARGWLLGGVVAVASLLLATQALHVGAHSALERELAIQVDAPGLGLARYHADIQARPIEGLGANVSGLSYNRDTATLFVVINRPPSMAEITLEGRLLRRFALPGVGDPEGISHIEGERFLISDESDNSLHWVRIRPGDHAAEVERVTGLPLGFGFLHNLGFEGVSWDETRAELLLVNEKWPRRVLIVQNLVAPGRVGATPPSMVRDWWPQDGSGLVGTDLSSLTVHPRSGNLLLLSDESAALSEYSRQGRLLGVLPLWQGRGGLDREVPQAEGLTIGPDDAIYIVSEPNLLYRFVAR